MTRHLMAKFRRQGAGGDGFHFDWQAPDRWSSGSEAKLENGDWIMVKPHLGRWEYTLFGPPLDHDDPEVLGKPGYMFFTGYGDKPRMAAEILGRRHWRDGLDTHEEAKRAAEQHYMEIAPTRRGKKLPGGDLSRYDDISKPAPLDDDYGPIFGSRLAQLSHEEVMRRIDEQLAAGEPEDYSDYSTDYDDDEEHFDSEEDFDDPDPNWYDDINLDENCTNCGKRAGDHFGGGTANCPVPGHTMVNGFMTNKFDPNSSFTRSAR